jgi:3D (Asp-Asp-Asp) domain-containing protein
MHSLSHKTKLFSIDSKPKKPKGKKPKKQKEFECQINTSSGKRIMLQMLTRFYVDVKALKSLVKTIMQENEVPNGKYSVIAQDPPVLKVKGTVYAQFEDLVHEMAKYFSK